MKRKRKPDKDEMRRRYSAHFKNLVLGWLRKLATNYRVELTDKDPEFWLDVLPSWSDYQINTAFALCMKECLFFPHLADVIQRMPEDRQARTLQLCDNCRPDGWRLILVDGYIKARRCDHDPNNPPNPSHQELKNLWSAQSATLTETMTAEQAKVRFPHLIGKGIIYGDGK